MFNHPNGGYQMSHQSSWPGLNICHIPWMSICSNAVNRALISCASALFLSINTVCLQDKTKSLKIQHEIHLSQSTSLCRKVILPAWTKSLNLSQSFFTPTLEPVKPYLSFQGTPVTSSCSEIKPFLKLQRKSLSMWTEKYHKSHSCIANAFPQWQNERTQCFSVNHSLLHSEVSLMLLELKPQ